MLSLVELKNVVIDGVTFTGKGGYDPQGHGNAINLSGNNIKVDGLTLKNCVLENESNNARLLYKTESTTHVHTYTYGGEIFTFSPSLKDITVTGCTFNGGYIGLEIREAENVTITNNEFNVADRNILLPVNSGYTYTGNITITGNVSNNAKQRFVRMAGAGASNVVIKDNTISNYRGEDSDFIKVTDSTATPTIENNTISYGSTESVQEAINAGQKNIVLAEGNYVLPASSDVTFVGAGKDTVIDLDGAIGNVNISNATVTGATSIDVDAGETAVFENVIFEAKLGGASSSQYGSASGKVTFDGCTFERMLHFDTTHNAEIVIENCTFGVLGTLKVGAGTTNVEVKNCTFEVTTATSIWGEKGIIVYCPATFTDCEFNNRQVLAGSNGLSLTFNSCTMNGGTPVYYVDNTDGIIRGGNVPNITINN